jgi:hypothetical protein
LVPSCLIICRRSRTVGRRICGLSADVVRAAADGRLPFSSHGLVAAPILLATVGIAPRDGVLPPWVVEASTLLEAEEALLLHPFDQAASLALEG